MKVGINAHAMGSKRGGDETYIRNIVRALGTVDPQGDYTLFLTSPLQDTAIPGIEHMRRITVRPNNPLVRLPISFPVALARERIDVVHVQYVAPPFCRAKIVVTVHDIGYERYPQYFSSSDVTQFRILVPLTIQRAAAIVTVSEFSKSDIVRRYRVPPEKVVVTYNASDPIFRPMHNGSRLAAVRERYGTGEEFILAVGNLQPRKNLRTLIDAYVRLRRTDATRHKLVLVGKKAWLYDGIFSAARSSGYDDELIFTGYVPDDDLVALYNAASLFIYPSIYEGFGLPPLEAMACGTPVITSNTSALPEIVGDAALIFDPLDVDALASSIAMVLRDTELQDTLSRRGLTRSLSFSWENAARVLLDTYQRVNAF